VQFFFLPYLKENYIYFWNSFTLPDIRPDIRLSGLTGYPAGHLVSGRIPDIKKGRIIRPDIRCISIKNV
jgi:hypothetical protein